MGGGGELKKDIRFSWNFWKVLTTISSSSV
jgi:hypothetical protein